MGEISLSSSEVALFVSLLGVIAGGLSYLHHALLASKDRQIDRLEKQMDGVLLPSLQEIKTELQTVRSELQGLREARRRS